MIRINTTSRHSNAREWASMEELEADVWPQEAYRPDYDTAAGYVASLLDIPRVNVVECSEPLTVETASDITGIAPQHIALWLATIEEGHSPQDWDADAEAYYLGCFVGSEPQIVEENEALPFDEGDADEWAVTDIGFGRRLINRAGGR